MTGTTRRGIKLLLASIACLALAPIPVAGDSPPASVSALAGEVLLVDNSRSSGGYVPSGIFGGSFDCNADGVTGSANFTVAGNAYGPYEGTFQQQTTVQIGDGLVTSIDIEYQIQSGSTTIAGAAHYAGDSTFGPPDALCESFIDDDDGPTWRLGYGGLGSGTDRLILDYSATISSSSGSVTEEGAVGAAVNFYCLGAPTVDYETCSPASSELDFHGRTIPRLASGEDGTASTATVATADDPIAASIVNPAGGYVSLAELESNPAPTGYTILGRSLNIYAAEPTTADSPIQLTFVIHSSLLFEADGVTALDPGAITVARDGSPAPDCTDTSNVAAPDPCVYTRTTDGDGNLTLVVLTSEASTWSVVTPTGDAPQPGSLARATVWQPNTVTATCDGTTIHYEASGTLTGRDGTTGTYHELGTATLAGSADPHDMFYPFNTTAANVDDLSATWEATLGDLTYAGTRTLGSPVSPGWATGVGSCAPLNGTDEFGHYCTWDGCHFTGSQNQFSAWSDWQATVTGPDGSHHEFGSSVVNLLYLTGTYTLDIPDDPAHSGVGIPIPDTFRYFQANFLTATVGYVPSPGVELFTGAADLGSVELGQDTYPYILVYNWGTAPAVVSDVAVGGADAGDLTVAYDDCLAGPIAPGSQCTHEWEFTPTTPGPIDIAVSVASNGSDSPHLAAITGDVTTPRSISVTPSTYDYGDVALGSQAVEQFLVTNTGGGPVNIWSTDVTADWADFASIPIATDCTNPLDVAASCTVTVTFTPQSLGPKSANLYLYTDLLARDIYTPMTGTGVAAAPAVGISPLSHDYGTIAIGQSVTQAFTVENTGDSDLSIAALLLNGPDSGDFSVSSDACTGVQVAPGSTCTVDVEFVPGSLGSKSASLEIDTNAPSSPDLVALSGEATDPNQASGDPGPDGTIATGNGEATPDDPTTTAVTTPTGGTVSISEAPGGTPPTGYGFVGQAVTITAPAGTAADPIRIVFRLDASAIPTGYDASTIELFRNGVLVPECDSPGSAQAVPTPCVDDRSTLADGDIQITALTVQASLWNLAVTLPYHFSGFFLIVNNPPVVNRVDAGRTVPVIFRLGGNKGSQIFAAGGPFSTAETCATRARTDRVEVSLVTQDSRLVYDRLTRSYIYLWKTDRSWAGTCRTFTLALADGTTHTAQFIFDRPRR